MNYEVCAKKDKLQIIKFLPSFCKINKLHKLKFNCQFERIFEKFVLSFKYLTHNAVEF